MPTYIKIKIRRDTSSNWAAADPVLELGELGADMTKHGLKVGDGSSKWSTLPFCSPELVNDLIAGGTDKALTAEQGKVLDNQKADKTDLNTAVNNLQSQIDALSSGGGGGSSVVVENLNWTSHSTVNALSANSGRVLKDLIDDKADQSDLEDLNDQVADIADKVDGLGLFGMGYEITEFNDQSKPTKIKFEDGVTCTLKWYPGGTQLQKITASTGEVMTLDYDENDRITGRTITR